MCDWAQPDVVLRRDDAGRATVWCDPCIAPLVDALVTAGIDTAASCCGHGHIPGLIMLADGRELLIARDFDTARWIESLYPTNINGERPEDVWRPAVSSAEGRADGLD